jgi:hypothetical protein
VVQDRPPRNSDNSIQVDQFDLASKLWGVPLPGGPRIGATVTSGTIALNKAFLKSRSSKPEVSVQDNIRSVSIDIACVFLEPTYFLLTSEGQVSGALPQS